MLKVVAVRDRAIDAFGQPAFVVALGAAIRSFTDQLNQANTPFNQHPEDYDLYEIGEYDDSTGALSPCTPRMIAIGKDIVFTAQV